MSPLLKEPGQEREEEGEEERGMPELVRWTIRGSLEKEITNPSIAVESTMVYTIQQFRKYA